MDDICADDDDDINDGEHMLADNFAAVEAKNLIKNQSKKKYFIIVLRDKKKKKFFTKINSNH